MERNLDLNKMILLFDSFSKDSRNLYESFQQAGINCCVVVLGEESFLPEGVMSVYEAFLGDFRRQTGECAKPRYFNEITVPEDWKINVNGRIQYFHEQKGQIFYAEPLHKHYVKAVDWFDCKGTVRLSDYYNRYGVICSRSVYDIGGKRINRSWFSATGQEVIVENCVTGAIILDDNGKVKIFRTKMDFILYFFTKMGFEKYRIFFNSLSIPFFVSQRLNASVKSDVLFWQEPVGEGIPGNMQIILKGQANRASSVIVQKRQAYDRLLALGAGTEMVHRLGFIYPYQKENKHQPMALICTELDRLEHCRELIELLPEMQFHIVAFTDMSRKLMDLESFDNVILYPNVKTNVLKDLFEICDYYLDINYGAEVVSAVYRAFLHNHLIFAFEETIHNRDYVASDHIYPARDAGKMIEDIRMSMIDETILEGHLKQQRDAALAESVESYRGLL